MRPVLVAWALEHGVPDALVPGYGTLAGIAALLAAAGVLRLTRREGGDVRRTATTLLIAYGGALAGGYVYEWLRVTPEALFSGSVAPYLHVGRAAYGGLLFAALGAAAHLRVSRAPVGAFFDRIALFLGVVYALVRVGCLLEGCDYGVPSELALAVRYPAGSLAALEHAHAGLVPAGMASLPTHPTQLYEGAVALVASLGALAVYRPARGGRLPSGAAFAVWLVLYAIGRALVEAFRADASRGLYAGLSTAQWTSLAIVVAIAGIGLVRVWRAPAAPARAEAA
ncbi:MAG: prolipoprotein diacylglyceryl transferase [Sandaracinaceae bacterium]|nr:prolipoprotein diacylglyceryl transferase [Sandaracinaceae bacterium]